jgi:hypothetical protein
MINNKDGRRIDIGIGGNWERNDKGTQFTSSTCAWELGIHYFLTLID